MFDAAGLIAGLPEEPGVYRMLGQSDEILYVGKAKNLRRRVASYFQRSALSPRIRLMVDQVVSVQITATRSEAEALLLENNLIKSLAPKYNIIYRDDKSYPYIVVEAGQFPRLAFHRGSFDGRSRYFGPFPSAWAVRESIQLIQRSFRLRTCEESVFRNRSRPCLLYQINRCTAPCVGRIGEAEYARDVRTAGLFLEGRRAEAIETLTASMESASAKLDFEQAAVLRDQIRALQKVLHRTYVTSAAEENVDVVVAVAGEQGVCVSLAMVRGGIHLGDRTLIPRALAVPDAGEALEAFIEQHYASHSAPPRVVVNVPIDGLVAEQLRDSHDQPINLAKARDVNERAWLEMGEKNARIALEARGREATRTTQRIDALQDALDLAEPPRRIECFDVSHTGGESAVASCVVYAGGRMQPGEYRRYNMRGITPGDDYAGLRQALARRYEKVAAGQGLRPDLILIDGGRGQLTVAREVLVELGLEELVAIGVAKGAMRKPGTEELIMADYSHPPLVLGTASPALQLIQEIRDEAHRFALAGHRMRRAGTRRVSSLEDIPGIGPARRRRLITHFGGLQGVIAATVDDLCRVPGIDRALAGQIYQRLH